MAKPEMKMELVGWDASWCEANKPEDNRAILDLKLPNGEVVKARVSYDDFKDRIRPAVNEHRKNA